MRLRRKSAQPSSRQRLRAGEPVEVAPPRLSYRARRSQTDLNASQPASPQAKRSTSHFWLQRFGFIILLIAALASAVNILSLSSTAKVVPLTGGQASPLLRDPAIYQAAASQQLAKSIWNRNKITVNSGAVSQQLLEQFPELASVSVTVPLLAHRPVVYVQPAQPAVILVTGAGAYVVDTTGRALLKGPTAAALNQPTLPVITDQSGLSLSLNHTALPANNVSFLQTVQAQLAAKHFKITAMTLPAAASELDIQLDGQPYTVKFNLQSNTPRQQAGTFLATIGQLQKQSIVPAHYIDVRVDGRAYYQ